MEKDICFSGNILWVPNVSFAKVSGSRVHQSVVKVKGLSLKGAHSQLINYEVIESIAKEYLEHGKIATMHVPQRQFKYSSSNLHGIQTSNTLKSLKINPRMKGKLIDGYLYPFGYEFSGE